MILTVGPALSSDPPWATRRPEGFCLLIILPPGVGILAGGLLARIGGEGSGRLELVASPPRLIPALSADVSNYVSYNHRAVLGAAGGLLAERRE